MSYKNSVVIPYRNRISCLKVLLRSLYLASKNVDKKSYEIIIVDLGYNRRSKHMYSTYKDRINLRFLHPEYNGPFWKTKTINYGIKRSFGNYITMIDADSLVNCNFLQEIQIFFNINKKKTKLCHRVRFLTPITSRTVVAKSKNLTCKFINTAIANRSSAFSLARERFTGKEKLLKDIPKDIRKYYFDGRALGNGYFSMPKDVFMDVGGFDERFVGYGLEDLDFNRRVWNYIKSGTLRPDPAHTVFHVYHKREADWHTEKLMENNRKVYRKNKKKGIVCLEKKPEWGEF
ncbi:MAG: glycosyltransferase [Candidatus Lokiarchaeota archaeon]|nr:glycosyltransferase [Candidatus Lokiarchaeota archaeon]